MTSPFRMDLALLLCIYASVLYRTIIISFIPNFLFMQRASWGARRKLNRMEFEFWGHKVVTHIIVLKKLAVILLCSEKKLVDTSHGRFHTIAHYDRRRLFRFSFWIPIRWKIMSSFVNFIR